MQVGDIVKHKNIPDRLRDTDDGSHSCLHVRVYRMSLKFTIQLEVKISRLCITRIENLLPYQEEQKQQLNLF